MSGNKTIRTTGELRDFLAMMMVGVKNGDLDLDKARNITKLAGQINESFYAEVKVAKVRAEAGAVMPALGAMLVGNEAPYADTGTKRRVAAGAKTNQSWA